jgi:glycosyltransferase involved in cell wall biosynthesis
MPESEEDVIRIPAVQHFNGSDFSVVLPVPGSLSAKLEDFEPDIIHAHHPYLLGGTAVRVARHFERPLLFTYHTMYEHYLHYVPTHAKRMQQFVINLVTGYCSLCDQVIAPSESVAEIIRSRGVASPIAVVPTGVDTKKFAQGDGLSFRRSHGIPAEAVVAGYVGRLAPEKNLTFLAQAMRAYASSCPKGHFLVVGSGPSQDDVRSAFGDSEFTDRLHLAGSLEGQELIDAYHAVNVFVFASHTETQGMVLTEAMAAGKPVVAVDAPGVREVVADGLNGRLLDRDDSKAFAIATRQVATSATSKLDAMRREARETARRFSMEATTRQLVDTYDGLMAGRPRKASGESAWKHAVEDVKAEWDLLKNVAEAATETLKQ